MRLKLKIAQSFLVNLQQSLTESLRSFLPSSQKAETFVLLTELVQQNE